jgi:hypothetical protein
MMDYGVDLETIRKLLVLFLTQMYNLEEIFYTAVSGLRERGIVDVVINCTAHEHRRQFADHRRASKRAPHPP